MISLPTFSAPKIQYNPLSDNLVSLSYDSLSITPFSYFYTLDFLFWFLFFNFTYFETIEGLIWQDKIKHLANKKNQISILSPP